MSDVRDKKITLDDLRPGEADEDPYAGLGEFTEVVSDSEDLLAGVAGCFVHPDIPCMQSCRAYNLYKDEDEPECRIIMALESIGEAGEDKSIQVERNQILSKIEKTLASLLQQLQRMATS